MPPPTMEPVSTSPRLRWWAFAPYVIVSLIHIGALSVDATDIAAVTKILLMPLLACAVVILAKDVPKARTVALAILGVGIGFSWIGDEAAVFFPFAPELPVMLAAFGVAHLAYIWLFNRHLAVRRLPVWTIVYVAWWVGMLAVLWPRLGALSFAVAAYGLVLGGTAASAARCHPIVAIGGALFLCSDTILAFRLFIPEAMPHWTSPLVMITYCGGQGLIAAGTIAALRTRAVAPATQVVATP
jgi:uncharacterized membrane protein YhhN